MKFVFFYRRVEAVRTSGTTGFGGGSIHQTRISLIAVCGTRLEIAVALCKSGWLSGGLRVRGGGGARGIVKWIEPFGGPWKQTDFEISIESKIDWYYDLNFILNCQFNLNMVLISIINATECWVACQPLRRTTVGKAGVPYRLIDR